MSLPMRPKWMIEVPGLNFGRPAVTRGLAVYGTMGGEVTAPQGACRAVRVSDGVEAWSLGTAADMRDDALVEQGIVYCHGLFLLVPGNKRESFVFAIDAQTGVQRWRAHLPEWIGAPIVSRNDDLIVHAMKDLKPAPITSDDITCLLYVLDKATGSVKQTVDIGPGVPWVFSLWNDRLLAARGDHTAVELYDPATWTATRVYTTRAPIEAAAQSGDRCYVVERKNADGLSRVTALHLGDGVEEWTQTYPGHCWSVFAQGEVVAVSMSAGFDDPARVCALDPANGLTRWSYPAGNREPAIEAVIRGMLLVQTRQRPGTPETTVTAALDLRDGRELFRCEHPWSTGWVVDAGGDVALASHVEYILALDLARFWSVPAGGAVRGAPAASGADVVVGSASGRLSSLSLETGRVRWTRELGGAIEGSVALAQGRVFAGHARGVTALEAGGGAQVWSYSTPQKVTAPVQVLGGAVVFGARDGVVRALASTDGAELWRFPTGGFVEGGVASDGAGYYVGSADGSLYALHADGSERWHFTPEDGTIDEIKSTPLVAGGRVVVGNAGGHLYALAAADGTPVWQTRLKGGLKTSGALLHTAHFWIGDDSGQVYRIALADGSVEWTAALPGAVRSTPAWSRGELYVSTMAGAVAVLDIWTGKVHRSVRVGAPVFASPVATPSAVVVADEQGGIHALVPGI